MSKFTTKINICWSLYLISPFMTEHAHWWSRTLPRWRRPRPPHGASHWLFTKLWVTSRRACFIETKVSRPHTFGHVVKFLISIWILQACWATNLVCPFLIITPSFMSFVWIFIIVALSQKFTLRSCSYFSHLQHFRCFLSKRSE